MHQNRSGSPAGSDEEPPSTSGGRKNQKPNQRVFSFINAANTAENEEQDLAELENLMMDAKYQIKKRKSSRIKRRVSNRSVMGEYPHHIAQAMGDANFAYVQKKYDEVLELCRTVIHAAPAHGEAYSLMGLVYEELKDYKRAADSYRLSALASPQDAGGWRKLARLSRELGDSSSYKDAVGRVALLDRNDLDAALEAARLCIEAKEYYRALRYYQIAIDNPNTRAVPILLLRMADIAIQHISQDSAKAALLDCVNWCVGLTQGELDALQRLQERSETEQVTDSAPTRSARKGSSSLSGEAEEERDSKGRKKSDASKGASPSSRKVQEELELELMRQIEDELMESDSASEEEEKGKSERDNTTEHEEAPQPAAAASKGTQGAPDPNTVLAEPHFEWVEECLVALNLLCQYLLQSEEYALMTLLLERANVYSHLSDYGPLPPAMTVYYGICMLQEENYSQAGVCLQQLELVGADELSQVFVAVLRSLVKKRQYPFVVDLVYYLILNEPFPQFITMAPRDLGTVAARAKTDSEFCSQFSRPLVSPSLDRGSNKYKATLAQTRDKTVTAFASRLFKRFPWLNVFSYASVSDSIVSVTSLDFLSPLQAALNSKDSAGEPHTVASITHRIRTEMYSGSEEMESKDSAVEFAAAADTALTSSYSVMQPNLFEEKLWAHWQPQLALFMSECAGNASREDIDATDAHEDGKESFPNLGGVPLSNSTGKGPNKDAVADSDKAPSNAGAQEEPDISTFSRGRCLEVLYLLAVSYHELAWEEHLIEHFLSPSSTKQSSIIVTKSTSSADNDTPSYPDSPPLGFLLCEEVAFLFVTMTRIVPSFFPLVLRSSFSLLTCGFIQEAINLLSQPAILQAQAAHEYRGIMAFLACLFMYPSLQDQFYAGNLRGNAVDGWGQSNVTKNKSTNMEQADKQGDDLWKNYAPEAITRITHSIPKLIHMFCTSLGIVRPNLNGTQRRLHYQGILSILPDIACMQTYIVELLTLTMQVWGETSTIKILSTIHSDAERVLQDLLASRKKKEQEKRKLTSKGTNDGAKIQRKGNGIARGDSLSMSLHDSGSESDALDAPSSSDSTASSDSASSSSSESMDEGAEEGAKHAKQERKRGLLEDNSGTSGSRRGAKSDSKRDEDDGTSDEEAKNSDQIMDGRAAFSTDLARRKNKKISPMEKLTKSKRAAYQFPHTNYRAPKGYLAYAWPVIVAPPFTDLAVPTRVYPLYAYFLSNLSSIERFVLSVSRRVKNYHSTWYTIFSSNAAPSTTARTSYMESLDVVRKSSDAIGHTAGSGLGRSSQSFVNAADLTDLRGSAEMRLSRSLYSIQKRIFNIPLSVYNVDGIPIAHHSELPLPPEELQLIPRHRVDEKITTRTEGEDASKTRQEPLRFINIISCTWISSADKGAHAIETLSHYRTLSDSIAMGPNQLTLSEAQAPPRARPIEDSIRPFKRQRVDAKQQSEFTSQLLSKSSAAFMEVHSTELISVPDFPSSSPSSSAQGRRGLHRFQLSIPLGPLGQPLPTARILQERLLQYLSWDATLLPLLGFLFPAIPTAAATERMMQDRRLLSNGTNSDGHDDLVTNAMHPQFGNIQLQLQTVDIEALLFEMTSLPIDLVQFAQSPYIFAAFSFCISQIVSKLFKKIAILKRNMNQAWNIAFMLDRPKDTLRSSILRAYSKELQCQLDDQTSNWEQKGTGSTNPRGNTLDSGVRVPNGVPQGNYTSKSKAPQETHLISSQSPSKLELTPVNMDKLQTPIAAHFAMLRKWQSYYFHDQYVAPGFLLHFGISFLGKTTVKSTLSLLYQAVILKPDSPLLNLLMGVALLDDLRSRRTYSKVHQSTIAFAFMSTYTCLRRQAAKTFQPEKVRRRNKILAFGGDKMPVNESNAISCPLMDVSNGEGRDMLEGRGSVKDDSLEGGEAQPFDLGQFYDDYVDDDDVDDTGVQECEDQSTSTSHNEETRNAGRSKTHLDSIISLTSRIQMDPSLGITSSLERDTLISTPLHLPTTLADIETYYNLGRAYHQIGQYALATAAYERVLAIDMAEEVGGAARYPSRPWFVENTRAADGATEGATEGASDQTGEESLEKEKGALENEKATNKEAKILKSNDKHPTDPDYCLVTNDIPSKNSLSRLFCVPSLPSSSVGNAEVEEGKLLAGPNSTSLSNILLPPLHLFNIQKEAAYNLCLILKEHGDLQRARAIAMRHLMY